MCVTILKSLKFKFLVHFSIFLVFSIISTITYHQFVNLHERTYNTRTTSLMHTDKLCPSELNIVTNIFYERPPGQDSLGEK